ncbi:MAG: universal stress protein [Chloroflexota bacterium]|nr:universal stress protein [Chloroflexota bacterium]
MYEHLLVALDGSPTAERVLDHTQALAKAFGSTVTLFRATVSPEALIPQNASGGPAGGDVAPIFDPTPILEADRAEAVRYLDGVAARLKQQHNLNVFTEHFDGSPAAEIIERAGALGVSLILMTTHGRSGLGRMVFGSVADSVLRHAPCPVLLVRVPTDDDTEAERPG